MNVEIEVKDLKIKIQSTDRKHVDKLILAAVNYMNGGSFEEAFLTKEEPKKEEPKQEKKSKAFIPEVNGTKTYANGTVGYKCKYSCTCGHEGIRYAQLNDDWISCHRCNTKLNLVPATLNEAHDKDFNYFVAY